LSGFPKSPFVSLLDMASGSLSDFLPDSHPDLSSEMLSFSLSLLLDGFAGTLGYEF
jgi:hypothetical protein